MRRILREGGEANFLVPECLPMLIHGIEGSGASLYTICLASNWFLKGHKILFLCGYPMAEEEFSREVGSEHKNAQFYTQEEVNAFMNRVKDNIESDTFIIIKNIELFGNSVFDLVKRTNNFVVSGDISKVSFKDTLLKHTFTTKIYFSPLNGEKTPQFEKYRGYVNSKNYKGTTYLSAS